MMRTRVENRAPWGHAWRSSNSFIVSTMCLAIFTDELLFAFMLPLLPTVLEQRIGLDPSLTQRFTSIFLAEGAFISVISSPIFGSIADAISGKKTLLLLLLVLTVISTACLSLTTHLIWLLVGRFFQCLTSNGIWIVGMSTMAENIGSEHMGKIAGLTSTLTAAGTTGGPILAGVLFELGGYWCAWMGPAVFLLVDISMRLIMIEKQDKPEQGHHDPEQDPLLKNQPARSSDDDLKSSTSSEGQGWRFYALIFRQRRFSSGVFCAFVFALLIGCIESTLAVHIRNAFGWGALHVGLLLAWIQGPGMVLAAPVGWMKDKFGSRCPTAFGFLALSPFLIFLGIPGSKMFHWATDKYLTQPLFVVCMALIGCLLSLLGGVGTMQATEAVDILEAENPGVFGPNGGYFRALAITNMTWMAGLMTGPLLAELIIGRFAYFELQCCLGGISFVAGIMALVFLGSPVPKSAEQMDEDGA
ncbi:major facilitator superfamily domain-containing protein [Aspergillus pseudonomiae]|uniref:Major facilitator superfamily domain-containing protein n=1 Tax=Aspergillus pseudonomiae TaxID=1506151 RepID=A0A5N7D3I3_9EURO|nr:major facilitator superfamily domain-containing protein [Aspergillus pseudonomiae]KAE8400972.1 major facilitator superfamily domain-containing protein [Aspergillus pseudonomiae]